MELLLIFFGLLVILVVIVMIKYYTDPKMRKASDLLIEFEEKKRNGELNKNNVGYIEDETYIDSEILEDIIFDLEEYTISDDSIELPIRGINFRNLSERNIGAFDGYIMPDKNNEYDKHAIGVYSNDDKLFGYIEKGQKSLYKLIESGKGYIDASLEISTFIDEHTGDTRFYGTVTIDKEYLS